MSPPEVRRLYVAEPSAIWLQRPPVVVDSSVLAALLWSEDDADVAAQLLTGRALHAPSLLRYEVTNVARNKQRGGMDAALVQAGLQSYVAQKIAFHEPEPLVLFELAASAGLTAYDAAYLWLAAELRAPLATFDKRLADAARRHLSGSA